MLQKEVQRFLVHPVRNMGFLLLFQWKQNAPTLARWAIGQTLMINQLIDMEWKFGGN